MNKREEEKQKIKTAEEELRQTKDASIRTELEQAISGLRASFYESFGPEYPEIVSVQNLVPVMRSDGMPTIEEAVRSNRGEHDEEIQKDFAHNSASTPFSTDVIDHYDYHAREALDKFRGQIVVDLGAGWSGLGYFLAELSEARGYIGVEAFWPDRLEEFLREGRFTFHRDSENAGCEKIPVAIAPEDMLTFLRRLPDHSVSVFASGIDSLIIPQKYLREVTKEIERVLHPDGAFIMNESVLHSNNLHCEDIRIGKREGVNGHVISLYTIKTEKES